ncbi:hypothetical protein QM012_007956 [Aureobasidium pullulans]|uniref:UBC core domain-containing protein n=1 Tax=Aureobasidium pullulans TaxID=5580 RepID=A0ABR0TL72_AURPU
MPRKQFKADLDDAVKGKYSLEHINNCCVHEDGFTFTFTHPTLALPVTITVSVPEQSDYPTTHYYTLFCDDNAPKHVAQIIDGLGQPTSMTINQFLLHVSDALSGSSDAESDAESLQDHDSEDDLDDEDIYGEDFDNVPSKPAFAMPTQTTRVNPTSQFQSRVRSDLRRAKDAGCKIAYFGGLLDNYSCVVSVSMSARKLGISEEAMQAWRIKPSDYIILLLQYKEGYKTKEELIALAPSSIPAHLEMRVGASKHYKPTQEQVINAFDATGKPTFHDLDSVQDSGSEKFRDTFISKPLKDLLCERLVYIVRYRDAGMSWQGAEDSYLMRQNEPDADVYAIAQHFEKEDAPGYPAVVTADHLNDRSCKTHSFPLVAMQFTLRHFVRCTEFCLVCHKKLSTAVEALKPYVCDEPLCLYQYMTLGFGPSIEHEIMHQDKVVDLLVSFCYSSASLGRLKTFPTGLALSLPRSIALPIQDQVIRHHGTNAQPATPSASSAEGRLQARFDVTKSEILFDDANLACPLRKGDWVAIELPDEAGSPLFHCRIQDTLGPSAKTGPLVGQFNMDFKTAKWSTAFIDRYNTNFDDLQDIEKRGAVQNLLALLPSVQKMKAYLLKQSTPDLSRWVDTIPPAALGILRWTLASNRSCIVEVEHHQAVHGMSGYVQFRFAMGAPDKEARFLKAVKETTARLKSKYPTFYAWHGSMLQNWHSIIREGLHFNETLNGRAFGHGVYHSSHYGTSLGYSGMYLHYQGSVPGPFMWPNSDLQISGAIALNEIVNAPDEFVSKNPHYVISQLDWIQTRYLFVKCGASADGNIPKFDQLPEHKLEQDPTRIPSGEQSQIVIPALRIKTGKRKLANTKSPGPKKTKKVKSLSNKITKSSQVTDTTGDTDDEIEPVYDDSDLSDSLSVATDDEDLEIFKEPQTQQLALRTGPPQTDFIPGSLDHGRLPKLPMPSYANIKTSKRLAQDLKSLLDVQNKTPLHELGWYIDPSKADNLYQWHMELHSFNMFNEGDRVLPLVADMKKHNVKSIVLELRFPGSYPDNPPFIRVVRPRFLPFANGGGGHVTAGGAICHAVLTTDGWLCTTTIESVLLQLRMAMASVDPKPARLQIRGTYADGDSNSYGTREAIEAYKRACMVHGWTIPADFDQTVAEEPQ